MGNRQTDVQVVSDYMSKPLPFEDRHLLEKSVKAAVLLEQIAQFTYIEARACSTLGI